MITIKINTDNAAFSELSPGTKVARILRGLADKLYGESLGPFSGDLSDSNGNFCGTIKVTG